MNYRFVNFILLALMNFNAALPRSATSNPVSVFVMLLTQLQPARRRRISIYDTVHARATENGGPSRLEWPEWHSVFFFLPATWRARRREEITPTGITWASCRALALSASNTSGGFDWQAACWPLAGHGSKTGTISSATYSKRVHEDTLWTYYNTTIKHVLWGVCFIIHTHIHGLLRQKAYLLTYSLSCSFGFYVLP